MPLVRYELIIFPIEDVLSENRYASNSTTLPTSFTTLVSLLAHYKPGNRIIDEGIPLELSASVRRVHWVVFPHLAVVVGGVEKVVGTKNESIHTYQRPRKEWMRLDFEQEMPFFVLCHHSLASGKQTNKQNRTNKAYGTQKR
jgi:hypothetical protein